VTVATFEQHVQAALDSLPPAIAAKLVNVAVVVEDTNREEPDLYGLFSEEPYMPARVSIYRRPLEEDFGDDPDELEREIRVTVLHELAHYSASTRTGSTSSDTRERHGADVARGRRARGRSGRRRGVLLVAA